MPKDWFKMSKEQFDAEMDKYTKPEAGSYKAKTTNPARAKRLIDKEVKKERGVADEVMKRAGRPGGYLYEPTDPVYKKKPKAT